MALTTAHLTNASPDLEDYTVALFTSFFRALPEYQTNSAFYAPRLAAAFVAASGTVKGRQLNALMGLIDELGTGEVEVRGDLDAVWYSQSKERLALIREAFLVLFDNIDSYLSVTGLGNSYNINAGYQARQRPVYCNLCGNSTALVGNLPVCNCSGRGRY